MSNKQFVYTVSGILVVIVTFLLASSTVQGSFARLLPSMSQKVKETVVPKQQNQTSNIEYAVVNRVIDGDTVLLEDGRMVRYLYIDTPETVKPDAPVECFGHEAKELNRALVEQREIVMISEQETKDDYGRELRIVFLKGSNLTKIESSINAQLVEKGYARAKIYKPNTNYETQFQKLEQEAQSTQRGLWNGC